ncbi:Uma2 family endonuclease [Nocardiopsis sp. LOL_012]|uniref:Uma2 family endonuclease n=1 Tax=Nocardiopsis sp. LOL_012 TaxID=3345409 RepID=UPI003A8C3DBC
MDLPTLAENLELPQGYRTEVIDGSIVVSPTPTYRHAWIVKRIERAIDRAQAMDRAGLQMVTVEISTTGDRYVPDLVVLPESLAMGQGWEGPDWIRPAEELELAVEVVSPSTSVRDWQVKPRGHARAGVPLYLVVDPAKGELALFSNPKGSEYRDVARALRDESVKLPEPFGIEIAVNSLLP